MFVWVFCIFSDIFPANIQKHFRWMNLLRQIDPRGGGLRLTSQLASVFVKLPTFDFVVVALSQTVYIKCCAHFEGDSNAKKYIYFIKNV